MGEEVEQLKKDHEVQKRNLEEEMAHLEHEQRGLEQEIPIQRAKAEEQAWQNIDELQDRNKEKLTAQIVKGVKKKD